MEHSSWPLIRRLYCLCRRKTNLDLSYELLDRSSYSTSRKARGDIEFRLRAGSTEDGVLRSWWQFNDILAGDDKEPPVKVALHRNGDTAAIAYRTPYEVVLRVWSLVSEAGFPQAMVKHSSPEARFLHNVLMSPNGNYAAVVCRYNKVDDNSVRIVRTDSDSLRGPEFEIVLRDFRLDLSAVILLDDPKPMLVVTIKPGNHYIIDLPTPKDAQQAPPIINLSVSGLVPFQDVSSTRTSDRVWDYDPSSSRLLSMNTDTGVLNIWNTKNRALIAKALPEELKLYFFISHVVESRSTGLLCAIKSDQLWLLDSSSSQIRQRFLLPSNIESRDCSLSILDDTYIQIIGKHKNNPREGLICYHVPFFLASSFDSIMDGDLSFKISTDYAHVGAGGFGDVYKTTWKCHSVADAREVAVKMIRMPVDDVKRTASTLRVCTSVLVVQFSYDLLSGPCSRVSYLPTYSKQAYCAFHWSHRERSSSFACISLDVEWWCRSLITISPIES